MCPLRHKLLTTRTEIYTLYQQDDLEHGEKINTEDNQTRRIYQEQLEELYRQTETKVVPLVQVYNLKIAVSTKFQVNFRVKESVELDVALYPKL